MQPEEPLGNHEDLQRLVERFARAKWITGLNIVTPGPFQLNWTELGRTRMLKLKEFLDNANKETFPNESDYEETEGGKRLAGYLMEALEDLMPPILSSTERQMLIGLAVDFRRYLR
jgi:hypothetical protein